MTQHTANYHLADSRGAIRTLDDARAAMSEIRRLTCQREIIVARFEKRIAALTAEAAETAAPVEGELTRELRRLENWIVANRHQFAPPNKRKLKTPDGEFGLQTTTRLGIDDFNAVLDYLMDKGCDDCIKVTQKLKSTEILKRIDAGERIPGARRDSGEIALCRVNRALVKEAVSHAQ